MKHFLFTCSDVIVRLFPCDKTKEAIVIDPGGSEDRIFKYLKSKDLRVTQIIHTHAHFDHCLGTKSIADAHEGCKIGLHKDDLKLYQNIPMQCEAFGVEFTGAIQIWIII